MKISDYYRIDNIDDFLEKISIKLMILMQEFSKNVSRWNSLEIQHTRWILW